MPNGAQRKTRRRRVVVTEAASAKPQNKPKKEKKKVKVAVTAYKKKDTQTKKEKRNGFQKDVAERIGSHGSDSRSPALHNHRHKDVDSNQETSINIRPLLTNGAIWATCMGVISRAITKGFGWRAVAEGFPDTPYQAFVYMVKTLEGAVADTVPMLTTAPRWMKLLYQALRPKPVNYKTGAVSYQFEVDSQGDNGYGTVPPVAVNMTDLSSYYFGFNVFNALTANGYSILAPPPSYTPDRGALAFQSLIKFYESIEVRGDETNPMWVLEDLTAPYVTSRDASAFAGSYAETGAASLGPGGQVLELFSETKIRAPLLARFTSYEAGPYRSNDFARMSGGTNSYLGCRVTEFGGPHEIFNGPRPVFKFIDFNEVVEILALTVGRAMEYATQDNAEVTQSLVVPMTFQNFKIMLRQLIMSNFGESQAMVQDLIDEDGRQFYPFLASPGCVGRDSANNAQVPLLLAENLRCLQRRLINNGGEGRARAWFDVVPVWGFYATEQQPDGYTYTSNVGGTPTQSPVFLATPGDEVPLNLLDGSFIVASSPPVTQYVDFNGTELETNITNWNAYLQGLTSVLMSLATLGEEEGISALESLTLTNHYLEQFQPSNNVPVNAPIPVTSNASGAKDSPKVVKRQKSKPHFYGTPPSKRVGTSNSVTVTGVSPYMNLSHIEVSTQQEFVSPVWGTIQQFFIKPTNRCGVSQDFRRNVTQEQGVAIEPYSKIIVSAPFANDVIDPGNGGSMISVFDQHKILADIMTKTPLGTVNQIEQSLEEAAAKGRGGFLGDIIGTIAGAVQYGAKMMDC